MRGKPFDILLVEDNPAHVELIIRSLQAYRVQIHCAPDGRAALDYLFQRGEYADPAKNPQPYIIILDLRLPKVDGLEVLRAIKDDEGLRHIPVIVLTTSETEKDIVQAYTYYANSYLVKPVDFDKFTQLMDDLGLYWLGRNRHPRL